MVRELFTLARSKKACILFIDEVIFGEGVMMLAMSHTLRW